MILFAFWMFLLGLVVGSFLNVCILRLPKGQSVIKPRSHCPRCGVLIRWKDNIPLLSFLLLRGRCRSCRAPISWQYPLVELATGLLFAGAVVRFWPQPVPILIGSALPAVLLAIAMIDYRHQIIPDVVSLPTAAIGLALIPFNSLLGERLAERAMSAFWGFLVAAGLWVLASAWGRVRRRDMLGGGDVKMMAALGIMLGGKGALMTIFWSSLFALLFQLPALVSRKKLDRPFPFGPFLAIGAGLTLYWSALSFW